MLECPRGVRFPEPSLTPRRKDLQRTLRSSVRCSGIALHSGLAVAMTLLPAPADSGIVFRRADRGGAEIAASWRNAVPARLCTTLRNTEGVTIATVEHLLAALAGCGIDNAVVEVDGPELPAMDGSAAPFVSLIEEAGTVVQDRPRRAIRVLEPVEVADGERSVRLVPGEVFAVTVEIDHPLSLTSLQRFTATLDRFRAEVAPARTYGFLEDAEQLRAAGLARGASLQNVVVVDKGGIVNADGLRYPDEFARHKVLDAIGDLYLAGGPLIGRFEGRHSGHALNHRVLAALFERPNAWRHETARTARDAREPAV